MKISKTKISILMAKKNLNQKSLADLAEMSRGNLSTIINGKTCRPDTVFRLAKVLDCDVTEIIE